ncbi:DUF2079 domain-containing protein [Pseudactinotalea sp. HY158]|nr:DUF2079 domain-containing protein [Pseudactinotalea sp. HY158]
MDGLAPARVSAPPAALVRARAAVRTTWPAWSVGALIAAIHTVWSWRQWARFDSPSWDLGIFTQLIQDYSRLEAPIVPIKGEGYFLLGDHFHPLLVVLAPFYRMFPSGFTLLVAQNVLLGISAGILTWLGVRLLGRWSGIAIGLAYGASWGLQTAVASQFHEVALAMPLLAASLTALVLRRHRAAALWALPLLGVKEDLGLTVAAIGVVIALQGGRRLGSALAAGGVAAFVLVTSVVLPALNPDGVWAYAEDSVLSRLLSDPAATLAGLTDGAGTKAGMVTLSLAITAFLALRSPIILVAVPTFAWRLTSDVPYHWGTDWHYSAPLMIIAMVALVDGLHRLAERTEARRRAGGAPVPATGPGGRFLALRAPVRVREVATGVLLFAIVASSQFPWSRLVEPEFYRPSPTAAGARGALATVTPGDRVVTDITLMAYLVPTARVYWLGHDNPVPDLIVLDRHSGVWGGEPPRDAAEWGEDRFDGSTFTQIYDRDGFLVAERDG